MLTGPAAAASSQLRDGLTGLHGAVPGVSDDELVEVLRECHDAERAAQRVAVAAVSELERRGVFAAHGQRPHTAVADLLGLERQDARRLVTAAEYVCPRTDLQGQPLPAVLPATAAAFESGQASVRHVEVIARLMTSRVAERLDLARRTDAEQQLASYAPGFTPTELRTWGTALLEMLDQDGAEPDEPIEPLQVDELFLTRNANGRGGRIKGRFDDAAVFEQIVAVIDAKSAPLTAEDTRTPAERRADAMGEVFGYVADHADLPDAGGHRPHLTVTVRLDDLEQRAGGALLDSGDALTPAALRQVCCDASAVPVVLGGTGQPLDVGRAQRTVPDGLRRAVATRDRGCAHPGCGRPPSWCQVHHIVEWSRGGATRLDNLVMLCRVHHREIHTSQWEVRIAADGLPEFLPPVWIDPERRPRRKPLPFLLDTG